MLAEHVFSVKKRFLAMYEKANAGHIGSSLSCAELLVFLKFAWMKDDDTFVLSKGHAVAALYSLLAEASLLSDSQIDSFYEEGTELPALPPFNAIKQIPFATGSLGHGLSLSAGMALGAKLNRQDRRFFCVTSDGELDEGSVWEAALFIAHHKLNSVVWIVDRNHIQAIGRTKAARVWLSRRYARRARLRVAAGRARRMYTGLGHARHAGRDHRQHRQRQWAELHAGHGGLPLPTDDSRAVRAGSR
jgi:transketolase